MLFFVIIICPDNKQIKILILLLDPIAFKESLSEISWIWFLKQ